MQCAEKCHWSVNDSFLAPIIMAVFHWPWSMTRNLWPSVIDCDQWQKSYGQNYKKCHWPWSMTKKSVIDWMYTIYGCCSLAGFSRGPVASCFIILFFVWAIAVLLPGLVGKEKVVNCECSDYWDIVDQAHKCGWHVGTSHNYRCHHVTSQGRKTFHSIKRSVLKRQKAKVRSWNWHWTKTALATGCKHVTCWWKLCIISFLLSHSVSILVVWSDSI